MCSVCGIVVCAYVRDSETVCVHECVCVCVIHNLCVIGIWSHLNMDNDQVILHGLPHTGASVPRVRQP